MPTFLNPRHLPSTLDILLSTLDIITSTLDSRQKPTLSCGKLCSTHSGASYNQREGCQENSRFLRDIAVQRRIIANIEKHKQT